MSDKPRQEFYSYAHQALPEIFFNDPNKFFLALQEHAESFPRYIWSQLEKLAEIDHNSLAEDISVELSNHGQVSIALLTLPKPNFPTETYFIALLYRHPSAEEEELKKFFTLEYGKNLGRSSKTVLCEWENEDRHRNRGEGPKPTKNDFLQKIINEYLEPKD